MKRSEKRTPIKWTRFAEDHRDAVIMTLLIRSKFTRIHWTQLRTIILGNLMKWPQLAVNVCKLIATPFSAFYYHNMSCAEYRRVLVSGKGLQLEYMYPSVAITTILTPSLVDMASSWLSQGGAGWIHRVTAVTRHCRELRDDVWTCLITLDSTHFLINW